MSGLQTCSKLRDCFLTLHGTYNSCYEHDVGKRFVLHTHGRCQACKHAANLETAFSHCMAHTTAAMNVTLAGVVPSCAWQMSGLQTCSKLRDCFLTLHGTYNSCYEHDVGKRFVLHTHGRCQACKHAANLETAFSHCMAHTTAAMDVPLDSGL